MYATHTTTETRPGMAVLYYAARLSPQDLYELTAWSRRCRQGERPASLLANYLTALVALETERRDELANGGEVLECTCPDLPTPHWPSTEVAAALVKLHTIAPVVDGELGRLFRRLFDIVVVECENRLELR